MRNALRSSHGSATVRLAARGCGRSSLPPSGAFSQTKDPRSAVCVVFFFFFFLCVCVYLRLSVCPMFLHVLRVLKHCWLEGDRDWLGMRDYYSFVRAVRDGCLSTSVEQPTAEYLGLPGLAEVIELESFDDLSLNSKDPGIRHSPKFRRHSPSVSLCFEVTSLSARSASIAGASTSCNACCRRRVTATQLIEWCAQCCRCQKRRRASCLAVKGASLLQSFGQDAGHHQLRASLGCT